MLLIITFIASVHCCIHRFAIDLFELLAGILCDGV
jgi:hypothetical protein